MLSTVGKITHNKDVANADKMITSGANAAEGLLKNFKLQDLSEEERLHILQNLMDHGKLSVEDLY